ncbi:DNA mismatch repair protein PMS1 isoform X2 [Rhodamnia argentea]|uniref:DNA mismatch repair protein PMS1 isoform X2 n=1 Tax=Rhodamnia argentea TaxID=178133 RepID=A0ABM3HP32_9MYRT|nr:DNA mismatch repair protein PMS1 isoform X2 [Rhodamnia argentea]
MEAETPEASPSPAIRPINKSAVHRICAGQVILDLSSAVKELVENSLDAGATSIEIALKEYGQEWFQVVDNGCGISPSNFKVLALKHHTSKLADFLDLQSLTTFGFRGEALSSLCALGNLTVETRTKNESVATHLTFDHTGLLIAETKTARQVGTTVTVKKLFSNLPVRSKEFSRNIRKEYGKLISLMNAYALIAKGVRIVCTNTAGRNAKSVVLKTQGSGSLKDNIITVFGMNTFKCLEPVTISVSEDCTVEGFLSKPGLGSGRNLGDRQFFFVNGRPVDMPKVSKLVNELYKGANSKQYPVAVMDFAVPTRACDVNVTPDKRKIFFSDESSILHALRQGLQQIYSSSNTSFCVNKVEDPSREVDGLKMLSSDDKSYPLIKESPLGEGHNMRDLAVEHAADEDVSPQEVRCEIQASPVVEGLNKHKGDKLVTRGFTLRAHSLDKFNYFNDSTMTTHHKGITVEEHSQNLSGSVENPISQRDSHSRSSGIQSSLKNFVTVSKRKHENNTFALSEMPVLRNHTLHLPLEKDHSEIHAVGITCPAKHQQIDVADEEIEFVPSKHHKNELSGKIDISDGSVNEGNHVLHLPLEKDHSEIHSVGISCPAKHQQIDVADEEIEFVPSKHHKKELSGKIDISDGSVNEGELEEVLMDQEKVLPLAEEVLISKGNDNLAEDLCASDTSFLASGSIVDTQMPLPSERMFSSLQFSFQELQTRRQKRLSRLQSGGYRCRIVKSKRQYAAATLEVSQPDNEERKARALAAATKELEICFKKEDFCRMQVIGQFNLGFIVGKLDEDLFIVDQHAADEKFNFERLCHSTILNQQPLLRPLRLELSPEEEVVASMHMDTIRKNGFTLEEDPHAPPGCHFRLTAIPFSKNITFGVEDVKDLISTLADGQGECSILGSYRSDTISSVCPSRVRAMLASRACRSSVRIGDPLGKSEMQKCRYLNIWQISSLLGIAPMEGRRCGIWST